MPKILDKSVEALRKKGYPKSRAYAIATSNLQKHGYLKKGTQQPTKKATRKRK